MNQKLVDIIPERFREFFNSLPEEEKELLCPDEEINWDFVNFLREKHISLALFQSPYTFSHNILYQTHWTIDEFLDAIMQEQIFNDIGFNYNAQTDCYTIFYTKTEEGENE